MPTAIDWRPGIVLASLLVVGCYESRDAPPEAYRDGGGTLQGDAAAGRPDAPIEPDDDASAPPPDGAVPDGSTVACGDTIAPYPGTGCDEATRECLTSCAGEPTCSDQCIADDRQCVLCVDTTLARCANAAACQAEWDDFACCARRQPACERSSGLPLLACAGGCDAELVAYDECVAAVADSCIPQILAACSLSP